MYHSFQLAVKYIHYRLTASNGKGHGVHSPFVFRFIREVLNDKTNYPAYAQVESVRRRLLKDRSVLNIEDMGAGSIVTKSSRRSVASVARNAAKPKKFGQLLFRLVKYYQPATVLELGASLGITGSYLALANPAAVMITMEGSGELAAKARENFSSLSIQNGSVTRGNFDDTLSGVITQLPSVDFAFIDGNHRQEPTEKYFNQILQKVRENSILVFDDIHWSSEMEQAWNSIKDHPEVKCSIDLFFVGIVFFRKEFKEKQHFVIRF